MSKKKYYTIKEYIELLRDNGSLINNPNHILYARYRNRYRINRNKISVWDRDTIDGVITIQNITKPSEICIIDVKTHQIAHSMWSVLDSNDHVPYILENHDRYIRLFKQTRYRKHLIPFIKQYEIASRKLGTIRRFDKYVTGVVRSFYNSYSYKMNIDILPAALRNEVVEFAEYGSVRNPSMSLQQIATYSVCEEFKIKYTKLITASYVMSVIPMRYIVKDTIYNTKMALGEQLICPNNGNDLIERSIHNLKHIDLSDGSYDVTKVSNDVMNAIIRSYAVSKILNALFQLENENDFEKNDAVYLKGIQALAFKTFIKDGVTYAIKNGNRYVVSEDVINLLNIKNRRELDATIDRILSEIISEIGHLYKLYIDEVLSIINSTAINMYVEFEFHNIGYRYYIKPIDYRYKSYINNLNI